VRRRSSQTTKAVASCLRGPCRPRVSVAGACVSLSALPRAPCPQLVCCVWPARAPLSLCHDPCACRVRVKRPSCVLGGVRRGCLGSHKLAAPAPLPLVLSPPRASHDVAAGAPLSPSSPPPPAAHAHARALRSASMALLARHAAAGSRGRQLTYKSAHVDALRALPLDPRGGGGCMACGACWAAAAAAAAAACCLAASLAACLACFLACLSKSSVLEISRSR
jgi:hypothetical protein